MFKRKKKICRRKREYLKKSSNFKQFVKSLEHRNEIEHRSRWHPIVRESLISVPRVSYFILHKVCNARKTVCIFAI